MSDPLNQSSSFDELVRRSHEQIEQQQREAEMAAAIQRSEDYERGYEQALDDHDLVDTRPYTTLPIQDVHRADER